MFIGLHYKLKDIFQMHYTHTHIHSNCKHMLYILLNSLFTCPSAHIINICKQGNSPGSQPGNEGEVARKSQEQ